MSDKVITITEEEYEDLIDNTYLLDALNEVGVEDWTGYDEAWEVYRQRRWK